MYVFILTYVCTWQARLQVGARLQVQRLTYEAGKVEVLMK
jgi:hypothetical protein